MQIGLELFLGDHLVLQRSLEPGLTVLGRNPECDLSLPVEGVGPVHCVLRREARALFLDNHHETGTIVDDQTVTKTLQLAHGDEILMGAVRARVVFHVEEGSDSRTRTLDVSAAPANPQLVLSAASAAGNRNWPLSARGLSIGVDPSNDVVLEDPFVSSIHARLTLEGGRCVVRDLNSRNGVFVGEQKIREGEIRPGTVLRLGQTALYLESAERHGEDAEATGALARSFIGVSRSARQVRDVMTRLAATDAPVLVLGETGTGKEVVTRGIHALGARADRPLVVINCGALSRGLIESELFGHERGAFTGAIAQKVGAFETAHGGTLFLDEIGELPLELQPQLLRVLETGEVRRVGSMEPFRVDVRILAATNRQLEREVAAGRFREDLFHRLHVLTLDLPPLRGRPEDIEALADHFLRAFAPPGHSLALTPEARALLARHLWPGNVRELRNTLQRAALLRRSEVIVAEEITFTPSTLATRVQTESATSGRTLAVIERDAIVTELRRHQGSKKEAAAALGVARSTIHRKIDELRIDVDEVLRQD